MNIYLAPLEGVTSYIYRNSYEKYYGHIDKYFAPFISPSEKYTITPKEHKDLMPENNKGLYLVPQILTSNSEHFIYAAGGLQDLGYKEINLNLGCPSGTVCAKGKGAGFLPETLKLERFLDDIYNFSESQNIKISLKTRLGYFNPEEFYDLLEIFNKFPVSELIVHPRIRSDYYKGEPRYEYYAYALKNSKIPLVYNGNIFSKDDYDNLVKRFNQNIDTVMIGRGAISNPGLAQELINKNTEVNFWKLHDDIYMQYKEILSSDTNVLYRMKEYWGFWKNSFEDCDKSIKRIMKAKKCFEYENIIAEIK